MDIEEDCLIYDNIKNYKYDVCAANLNIDKYNIDDNNKKYDIKKNILLGYRCS